MQIVGFDVEPKQNATRMAKPKAGASVQRDTRKKKGCTAEADSTADKTQENEWTAEGDSAADKTQEKGWTAEADSAAEKTQENGSIYAAIPGQTSEGTAAVPLLQSIQEGVKASENRGET